MTMTLDELATSWLSRRPTIPAALPGLNNDLGAVQVEVDPVALKHPCFPPFSAGNEVTGLTLLNGRSVAQLAAVEVRWLAYRVDRRCTAAGWRLTSRTTLLADAPGAVVELTVVNTEAEARDLDLELMFSGRARNHGSDDYSWAIPSIPTDVFNFCNHRGLRQHPEPIADGAGIAIANEEGNAWSLAECSPKPAAWRVGRCPSWRQRLPSGGSFTITVL